MTGHPATSYTEKKRISQQVKECEQCSNKFYYIGSTEQPRVICDHDTEDAYFCSPYCESLWFVDQFNFVETVIFDYASESNSNENTESDYEE